MRNAGSGWMSKDFMHYKELMDRALRSVVREALTRVAKSGLPGGHHLYITFRTKARGVDLADRLRERFPDDMTIVLQHQLDRKSTRLNSSHIQKSRMPSSA